ncbi:hypothetical protein GOQ30_13955 [Flavobacterium sp. TP390]|uniref:Uncharacterized protein n=1 Tax=Flavobacterium profundi TaxID=1774945 RepID=A0A6I4ITS9_9FLAO|nr:hypothetical protein [Flavobacterium profundi]MVO10273.1 hypothetical protein [Flavobacterium profundi]
MKKTFFIITFILTYSSYSQVTLFNEKTNTSVNDLIKQNNQPSDFGETPLVVLDGKPIEKDKSKILKSLKSEIIANINTFNKTSETGKAIWGEQAEDGVLLISTTLTKNTVSPNSKDSKILFILDNKIISKEQAYALNPAEDVQDIKIYNMGSKFLLFNNEEYDAIMVLTSKTK